MKTIAYKDNAGGKLKEYVGKLNLSQQSQLFPLEKRVDRFKNAFSELRSMGNITVYFINGNKARSLFRKSF